MKAITVHAAKTNLSRLIERAERGEEVIIARRNTPVVKLVALSGRGTRKFGAMRGKARVTQSFFEPLSEVEIGAWEG